MAQKFTTFGIKSKLARNPKHAYAQFVSTMRASEADFPKFFDAAPFEDVYGKAYNPAPVVQSEVTNAVPEDADPMVAFVAATVEMQQRQTEQLRVAAEQQEVARREMLGLMRQSLKTANDFRKKSFDSFEGEMVKRRDEEKKNFNKFSDEQKAFLKATLERHTQSEKARLDQFRDASTAASKKVLSAQEDRFVRSVARVSATLGKHHEGIQKLVVGLKDQQDQTKELKKSIESKAAYALEQKAVATKETTKAIAQMGAGLKNEQRRGTELVALSVEMGQKNSVENVKGALRLHSKEQKKALAGEFKKQQEAQLKGLKAAVQHQKTQQQHQLAGLRDALEARRRATAGSGSGKAGALPVGISSTLSLAGADATIVPKSARPVAVKTPMLGKDMASVFGKQQ